MKSFVSIWLIFAFIFLGLSCFHFVQSSKEIDQFQVSERPLSKRQDIKVKIGILGSDIDKPLNDFAEDFNKYLDSYNKTTSTQNLIAGFGYIAAMLVSLVSMVLAIKTKKV